MVLFVKPFYYSVFDFTHSLQVSEVLLEFVAIRCHVLHSVVVANVFHVRKLVEDNWMPADGGNIANAHQ